MPRPSIAACTARSTAPPISQAQRVASAVCVQNHFNRAHCDDELPVAELDALV
ncbi:MULTISPECIES: hypothetical protein [unclassified Pseudomonas]|uniref:hypothetical protein n=1 Tax=unclassified Pseudomonas TaxID=196821 RepID=UPI0013141281|nr:MULTISPECIES: hypothetical protein [unclassified Pseudomonas]MBD9655313.1 hypothetical protein [Pseudomonas sp. PDM12]